MKTSTKILAGLGFAAAVGVGSYAAFQPSEETIHAKTPSECEQDAKTASSALNRTLQDENPGASKSRLTALGIKHPEAKKIASDLNACLTGYARAQSTTEVQIFGNSFKFGGPK